jgi:hypothetical protein
MHRNMGDPTGVYIIVVSIISIGIQEYYDIVVISSQVIVI